MRFLGVGAVSGPARADRIPSCARQQTQCADSDIDFRSRAARRRERIAGEVGDRQRIDPCRQIRDRDPAVVARGIGVEGIGLARLPYSPARFFPWQPSIFASGRSFYYISTRNVCESNWHCTYQFYRKSDEIACLANRIIGCKKPTDRASVCGLLFLVFTERIRFPQRPLRFAVF